MEIPPDTLEVVRVNDLFVVVTVDTSFTTEQTVVGHIDEIHILNEVRESQNLEDFLTKGGRVSTTWCDPTSSLSFSGKQTGITNTGESSMSDTPSLQSSCLDECVRWVG